MVSTHYQHLIDVASSAGVAMRVTSTVRVDGSGSYHDRGLAVDFAQLDGIDTFSPAGLAQMEAIFEVFAAHSSQLAELIHNQPATSGRTVKNGTLVPDSFWGADTWAAHANHVHVAIEEGTWLPVSASRTMYDDTNVDNYPPDAVMVAGYVDGEWPTYWGLAKRCPHAVLVSISVYDGDAEVLDVESGDATPQMAPRWVSRRHSRGLTAVLYCSESVWTTVEDQCAQAQVRPDGYWIADYDDNPTIPEEWVARGCVAKQYQSTDSFDLSTVLDTWPGLGRPRPENDVPQPLEITARLDCPTGGYWEQSYEGGIYAYDGAPFLGAYSAHPEWHNVARGFYDLVPCGKGYTQVSTLPGEHYDWPA